MWNFENCKILNIIRATQVTEEQMDEACSMNGSDEKYIQSKRLIPLKKSCLTRNDNIKVILNTMSVWSGYV
jgi:hypothetical protein